MDRGHPGKGKHLIDTTGLSMADMEEIFVRANFWRQQQDSRKRPFMGRFAANLFFEPSTRTRFSFEVAEKRLGLETLHVDREASSTVKGESWYDTLKTLSKIGVEVAVIRYGGVGLVEELAQQGLGLSLINAGEGNGSHPTQALLDLYTLQRHFTSVAGLTVLMVGDLRHSRVARSNLSALRQAGAKVLLSSPHTLRDPEMERVARYLPLDEGIQQADAVMMLRVQSERHTTPLSVASDYLAQYGLTEERFARMPAHGIIMHPSPVNRGVEIADSLVEHARSKIFEQTENGVWIRMAVLERALTRSEGHE